MQAMQSSTNSVVPAGLQELLRSVSALEQVASQVTPDGQPTIAGQVGQATQQMLGAAQAPSPMEGMAGPGESPGIMPGDPYRQQLMGTLQEKARAQAEAQAKMMQMMAAQRQGGGGPPQMASGGVATLPARNMARLAHAMGGVVGYSGEEGSLVESSLEEPELMTSGLEAASETAPALSAQQYLELQRRLRELKAQATRPRELTPQELAYQEAVNAEQQRGIASIESSRQRFEQAKQERLKEQEGQKQRDLINYLTRIGAGRRGTLFGNMAEAGVGLEQLRTKRQAETQRFREQEIAYMDKLEERRGAVESMRLAQMRGDADKARADAERIRTIDNDLSKLGINIGLQRASQLAAEERTRITSEAATRRSEAQQRAMDERAKLDRESRERIADARRKGEGAERTTDLMRQYNIELEALLAQGAPNDPATRKVAMNTAQAQVSKSAGTYRADVTAQEKADAWVQLQLLTGPRARELRSLRTRDPAAYKKEVEALEAEAERKYVRPNPAPARNPPSTAPAPETPAPPPGFVPR